MKKIMSTLMAIVAGLGYYQVHAVSLTLVQDAFWDDGFTNGTAALTRYMCTDYVSASNSSVCTNYIGTTVYPWDESLAQAALKFTLPQSGSILSTAKLYLKVMDIASSPTATVTLTDDNNWIQTDDAATSKFPTLSGASVLLSNASVSSTGWVSLPLATSALESKIVPSGTADVTLIIAGSTTASTYFNFVADDDASSDQAYLVLSFQPQVQSVSVPSNGTYKDGDALNFTVTFDSTVVVTGTPRIPVTLNTGGTVYASYVSGSNSKNLVFRYTVSSGELDADGVSLGSSISLNSGTIKSANNDAAELNLYSVASTTGVLVDGVVPTLSSVTPPGNGTYIIGQNLDYTVNFSEAVNVVTTSGTPYLTLTLGSTAVHAAYYSGSGGTALTFRYTVTSGDADANGVALGSNVTLSSGTIKDAAGNDATLTFTGSTAASVLVDGIAPTISGVTGPSAGTYALGDTLWFTATFSENVTVSGSPSVSVNVGGSSKQAVYASGSGTTVVKFRYVLASGDSDADGVATGTSVALNSGTIQDAAGNDATLTFTAPTTSAVLVDAVSPTISGVTGPSAGTYALGDTLWFTATASENVTVSGSPYIAVTVGSSSKQAVYASGSGTTSLKFRYVLATGDSDADGVAAASSVTLNSGTIQDAAGNDATLTFTSPTTTSVLVDGVAPTISGVIGPSAGTYALGDTLWFTATASENVTVSGSPYIAVTVGSSSKQAVYASGSGTTSLKFRYVLAAGDSDADGVAAASSVTLNSGTIQDAAGNAATLTFSAPATTAVLVDATAPTITSVTGPSAGAYTEGDTLWFKAIFSEDVTVAGTPSIALTIGTGSEQAVYASGSGSDTLKFYYVLAAGDSDPDGIAVIGSIATGSGVTIQDAVGNDATLTFTAPTTSGVIVADASTATIAGVVAPAAGTYALGDTIWFKVAFSEVVTVTGSPYITLTMGSSSKQAVYASGSGSDTLKFRYVLVSGDADANGIAMNGSITTGSGVSIVNGASNAAILSFTAPTTSGIVVDAVSPTIAGVVVPSAGTYALGDTLWFAVAFSENVTVTGTPTIALTVGSGSKSASYVSGSGNDTLKFRYALASGDADGVAMAGSVTATGSAAIADAAGNAATLTYTAPTTSGIVVDAVSPTIAGVVVPAAGTYALGDTLWFTVAFSENVTVTGTPTIALTVGSGSKSASYVSGSGNDTLKFRYALASGDADGVAMAGSVTATGGAAIADAAGNAATLTYTAPATSGILVDAVSPTITAVTVPTAGTYETGDTLWFTATFSENVTVTGTPYISLTIGSTTRQVVYTSGSGSSSLKFSYVLAVGDVDVDGISVSANIVAGDGSIKDAAGNVAALSLGTLATSAIVVKDTTTSVVLNDLGISAYSLSYVSATGLFHVQMPAGARHAEIILLDAAGHRLALQSLSGSADVRLPASAAWGLAVLRVNGDVKASWSGTMSLR